MSTLEITVLVYLILSGLTMTGMDAHMKKTRQFSAHPVLLLFLGVGWPVLVSIFLYSFIHTMATKSDATDRKRNKTIK
jgi:hypothetical protein